MAGRWIHTGTADIRVELLVWRGRLCLHHGHEKNGKVGSVPSSGWRGNAQLLGATDDGRRGVVEGWGARGARWAAGPVACQKGFMRGGTEEMGFLGEALWINYCTCRMESGAHSTRVRNKTCVGPRRLLESQDGGGKIRDRQPAGDSRGQEGMTAREYEREDRRRCGSEGLTGSRPVQSSPIRCVARRRCRWLET